MKSIETGSKIVDNKSFKILVIISILGTALGIFREIYIIVILGISRSNDNLQIYLSIIYNISLLGDVARLSVLNLLEKYHFNNFFGYGIFFYTTLAVIIGGIHLLLSDNLDAFKLSIVIIVGILNIVVVMISVYIQARGDEVMAQKIGVLPNFVLLPAFLIIYTFFYDQFIFTTLIAYLFVPVIQIFFLTRYMPKNFKKELNADAKIFLSAFILHSPLTLGSILAQIAVRNSLFVLGVGYLTVYNFLQKVLDSIRVILVETYVASNLKTWRQNKTNFLKRRPIIFTVLSVFSFSVVSITNLIFPLIELKILSLIFTGFCLQMLNRIAYIELNVKKIRNSYKVFLYTVLEFIFALIIYATSHNIEMVIYGYFSYFIVKNVIQMLLINF